VSSSTIMHRGRWQALAAAAAALGAIALGAPAAHAAVTATANDPATGFPFSYSDSVSGVELGLCVDGPPLCINTPRPDPATPASVPENFPPDGEAFWFDAEATITTGSGGKGLLALAQEATFDTTTGAPAAGHQIGFARIRVKATGLVPGATYTITHPYGVDEAQADDRGIVFTTEDAGCLAAPCAFTTPATSRMTTFLQWDPIVAPAAPTGYIGDPTVEHKVIGSPNDTNLFRIDGPNAGGPGKDTVSTDLFAVQGKFAGAPPAPAPHPVMSTRSIAFPDRQVGAASDAQTVTVTNHGTADQVFGAAAMGGTDGADFRVVADGCSNQTIAPAASCSVSVAFAPTATGARAASLVLADNSATSPHAVALAGTGTPGPAPAPIIVVAAPAPAPARAPAVAPLRVGRISAPSRVSARQARRSGLRVRFTVPARARVARVELLRGKRRVGSVTVRGAGSQSVRFKRSLRTGRYTVRIRVGRTLRSLGPARTRTVLVVR
jgi:hypothetical protein